MKFAIRDTYRPRGCRGGIGWYTLWLAEALSRELGGLDVFTQEPKAFPSCRALQDGAEFAGTRWSRGLALLRKIANPVRMMDAYDGVILPHPQEPAVRMAAGIQVLVVHDLIPLVLLDRSIKGRMHGAFFRQILPISMRRVDRIVVPSHSTKFDLLDRFELAPEKVQVIPNGFNAGLATMARGLTAGAWYPKGVPRDYLVYVGNATPHKNLRRLVQALSLVRAHLDVGLVLVGTAEPDWYQDLASVLGLEGGVAFIGCLPDADLAKVLGHARALVQPSLYEGFGMPPLEAMSVGVPVVASNIGSLPEVCGQAALYFDPYDVPSMAATLERILVDETVRHACVEEGLRQAGLFGWDIAARAFRDMIAEAA
ncbi:glycosyltransferase family 1 protein [uncultured Lamprocystis sp.]|jgi:glycosyltransferase involved in cell wall biosynthesis|uniref:glycosyltransferase family 4 protein n=1 Tax=uncultured Lamprocystis sp. TaxID=543132 RepID=UPI0025D0447E|nr:glycosyltransferase family 1 protein [uncultured Lamprocystis sp.]